MTVRRTNTGGIEMTAGIPPNGTVGRTRLVRSAGSAAAATLRRRALALSGAALLTVGALLTAIPPLPASAATATLVTASTNSASPAFRPHVLRTWSDAEGVQASPMIVSTRPNVGRSADRTTARAFASRVQQAWPQVEADLGSRLVAAALDPVAGNRLVVHVTGGVADTSSAALEQLDTNGGEVRVIEHAGQRDRFDSQLVSAKRLLGTSVGTSKVLQVSRDDIAGRIVIGVDRDSAGAQRVVARTLSLAVVTVVAPAHTADGGTFGSNPSRAQSPVAGGDTIVTALPGGRLTGCTSAFSAARGGVPVLISAGHCAYGTTGNTYLANYWQEVQPAIGSWVLQRSYGDTTDVAVLGVANQGPPRNCIVTAASGCRQISYPSARSPLMQGEPVTKTGTTSGETTGTITSTDQAIWVCDPQCINHINHTDAIAASNTVMPGDSGGVLYRDRGTTVEPLGITSGGQSGSSVYTNWRLACPSMGVDNCPTSTVDRAVVLRHNGSGGYTMSPDGTVSAFGGAPTLYSNSIWPGRNFARGMALRSDDLGGYILDGQGGIHPFGNAPSLGGFGTWSYDIARAIVLRSDNLGGYVLDGAGVVHAFGNAPNLAGFGSWPYDIARAMVLTNDNGGWVLDGQGGVHGFGNAPNPAQIGSWPYDIARSLAVVNGGTGGYVLDGAGGVHAFGNAATLTGPYWGYDVAKALAVVSNGASGVMVDDHGVTHPLTLGTTACGHIC